MRRRVPVLIALLVIGAACSRSEAAAADAVKTCAIPVSGAIAGHESSFYQCAETACACGPRGYLLGYGSKYSQRFYRDARPAMSPRGQQWIDDVLVCLQRELRTRIDASTSCEQIWSTAFATHPGCYVEAGFCSLSFWDLLRVVWTIDLADWLSTGASEQAVRTALTCVLR